MEFDCAKLNETFGIEGPQCITIDTTGDNTGHGIPSPRRTKCVYKGKEFNSMTEAAEYFGTSVSAVSLYIQRKGCHRYEMPVEYKGKVYKCIAEAAKLNNSPYSSVAAWVKRHNSYMQDGN